MDTHMVKTTYTRIQCMSKFLTRKVMVAYIHTQIHGHTHSYNVRQIFWPARSWWHSYIHTYMDTRMDKNTYTHIQCMSNFLTCKVVVTCGAVTVSCGQMYVCMLCMYVCMMPGRSDLWCGNILLWANVCMYVSICMHACEYVTCQSVTSPSRCISMYACA